MGHRWILAWVRPGLKSDLGCSLDLVVQVKSPLQWIASNLGVLLPIMSAGSAGIGLLSGVKSRASFELSKGLDHVQETVVQGDSNLSDNLNEAPLPASGDPVQVYATFVVKNISRVSTPLLNPLSITNPRSD